jgi:predicted lipoprotein with Yx(FWY)xxD motif
MRTNHRFGTAAAAVPSPWLVAAAVVATLAATILLLQPPATHAAQSAGPVVSTANTGLGRILVNSSGRTLYLFQKDRNGKSACAGQCAAFWPPLIAKAKPRVAGGARMSLIGTTRRADGRMQVTYNRHPLYMFAKDKKKGQTNGEGLSAFGAKWYAVSPAGAMVVKHSSNNGGGGGYNPYP